jgi:DNA-binding transcriptional LysR family regulator
MLGEIARGFRLVPLVIFRHAASYTDFPYQRQAKCWAPPSGPRYSARMVIRQFEYLVALAREQHFGRAAEACHVTQPTLSAAIRQFEEELGAPIIERGHRYLGLTPQGKLALEHAHRVLAEVEELKRGVEALDHGVSGRLRIGVIPTALPIVSHLTAPFFARYPSVTVAVLSRTSQDIQRGIEDFELDAGLTYLDNKPLERVRARPIYVEEYAFLTPVNGRYSGKGAITWREAAEAPLCLLTPDMQNRRIIDGVFRSVGATPRPSVETNSIFNLVSHAASGHWSAIVPRQLLQFFGIPETTRALELIEPTARRSIGLIIADRDPPAPLARNLMAMPLPEVIVANVMPLRNATR